MRKPILYLFVGYPGAGKTTASRLIQEKTGAENLWADLERQKMFGAPTHSPDENTKFYDYMNRLTGQLLSQGKSVIFDTNFNFIKDRRHLRTIADQNHADTAVIWITTPKELAKKRAVEESHNQGTRIYGNMSSEDFERIASHLEPPTDSEKAIKIDGTNLDSQNLLQQLNL